MKLTHAVILATCLAVGIGGYLVIGRPGMGDLPMSERQAEIMKKIREAPESLTPAETLARLERTVIEQPDAPEPHFFIGELLRSQNRLDDAARAYQSALRRDDTYVPALTGLANVLVELSDGRIGADAVRLYSRAYELDNKQVQVGMMAALGLSQAGDRPAAVTVLSDVLERMPAEDPNRPQVEALLQGLQASQP